MGLIGRIQMEFQLFLFKWASLLIMTSLFLQKKKVNAAKKTETADCGFFLRNLTEIDVLLSGFLTMIHFGGQRAEPALISGGKKLKRIKLMILLLFMMQKQILIRLRCTHCWPFSIRQYFFLDQQPPLPYLIARAQFLIRRML